MTTIENRTPKMHVALNVEDLGASVAFYTDFFDTPPDKSHEDYAHFELADPALVFTLNPSRPERGRGTLSHLGLRVDRERMDRVRARLLGRGYDLREERESTCCYAVQNKLWTTDPDGNDWEVYEFLGDASRHSSETTCCET